MSPPPDPGAEAAARGRLGSLLGLLVGNALSLVWAMLDEWSPAPILWVYLGHTLVAVAATGLRIRWMGAYTLESLSRREGQRLPEPTPELKDNMITIYLVVSVAALYFYGAAFIEYGVARVDSPWMVLGILANIALFAWVHPRPSRPDPREPLKSEPAQDPIGLMLLTSSRFVVPHLALLAIPAGSLALVAWLLLMKSGVDLALFFFEVVLPASRRRA